MNLLADNVRKIRKARDLSQKELAMKAGCSQTTISDIERNRNASTKELADIAKALDVTVEALLGKSKDAFALRAIEPKEREDKGVLVKSFSQIVSNATQGQRIDWYFGPMSEDSIFYKVDNDLMEGSSKNMPQGSIARIEPIKPSSGDVALFDIDSTPAFGVFTIAGGKQFVRPSNQQYQAIDVTEAKLIGVVKQFTVNC